MKKYLPDLFFKFGRYLKKSFTVSLLISGVFLFFFLLFSSADSSKAATATHIVISEIQIEGSSTTDEFVELYNPTSEDVDLTGWGLYKKTAATAAAELLLASLDGTIPSHGFFLIAHSGFDEEITPDIIYSSDNIADNNTVILKNNSSQIVDLVGMGTSNTYEGFPVQNPIDHRSIERKANSLSTALSMATGGMDEFKGNGEDTDNNANDFVRHNSPTISNPQNSSSPKEPLELTPTPTNEPNPTEEPTPTEQPEPTGDIEPTITPTEEITPTPTDESEVTPTSEPTPTNLPSPTDEPAPTETPAPTYSITPTLSPAPTIQPPFAFPNLQIVCVPKIISFNFFGKPFSFEFPNCRVIRVN